MELNYYVCLGVPECLMEPRGPEMKGLFQKVWAYCVPLAPSAEQAGLR